MMRIFFLIFLALTSTAAFAEGSDACWLSGRAVRDGGLPDSACDSAYSSITDEARALCKRANHQFIRVLVVPGHGRINASSEYGYRCAYDYTAICTVGNGGTSDSPETETQEIPKWICSVPWPT
jgi:hypothetical protein